MTNVTRNGNVFFTDDAEYGFRVDHGEPVVFRGDGSTTAFESIEDAEEAAEGLANGTRNDSDFEWND